MHKQYDNIEKKKKKQAVSIPVSIPVSKLPVSPRYCGLLTKPVYCPGLVATQN